MMDADLQPIYEKITEAVCAEDVFGVTDVDVVLPIDQMLSFLKVEFEELESQLQPDFWSSPLDSEAANDALDKLLVLYEAAKEKITSGLYGMKKLSKTQFAGLPFFKTSKRTYYLKEVLFEGGIATVYDGICEFGDCNAGEVIIKLVDDPAKNHFIRNEIRILHKLHSVPAPQWKHLPYLLDSFEADGRAGLILRKFRGCDLLEVRNHRRYKDGVDQKHMVWILGRTLSALYFAHSQGIIHTNIKPSHLMVVPDVVVGQKNHNVFLLDWSTALYNPQQTGEQYKTKASEFTPPEIERQEVPHFSSDIYSLGKVMIWLLGGNIQNDSMPDSVEPELQQFLKGFVLKSPLQRFQSVQELFHRRRSLIEKLWGPREYIPFYMD